MGPKALAQVLRPLARLFPEGSTPELLAGLAAGDDAAVYRLDDSRALIVTTDFFTPVVDDPFDFGSVAAANALSDVYAMGGEPLLALNIAGFPSSLPAAVIEEVFRGGAEKAKEAGCPVVGGHTITSQEPLYGLAVVGMADPRRLFLKSGVRPGDALVLTKPLGVGVITTALKRGTASQEAVAAAVASMKRLNRDAARVFLAHRVEACTDVTGFSLLGHALDLAAKSGVGLRIDSSSIVFVPGAREAGASGAFPAGTENNRAAFEGSIRFEPGVAEPTRKLLYSPETSGGLLAAVDPALLETCRDALRKAGVDAFLIGSADPDLDPASVLVR